MQTCVCIIHSILFCYALATAVNCENKRKKLDVIFIGQKSDIYENIKSCILFVLIIYFLSVLKLQTFLSTKAMASYQQRSIFVECHRTTPDG